MKTIILAGTGLLIASANVQAADTAQCDSKPFTLKKPAQSTAKPVPEHVKQAAPKSAKTASASAKPKTKPIADCDKAKG